MKCQNLDELRNKLFGEIISVVPHFSAMNNTEKFNFILSSQDLDINKILVISVFNMYNLNKSLNKGNNKITELRTILQRESPNS